MTTAAISLMSEVQKYIAKPLHKAWINGQEVGASDGNTFDTYDPGTGEKLASVAHMTHSDVDDAVRAAQQAFHDSGWAQMPANERGVILHRLADVVESRLSVIAQIEALDAGKIESQAQGDVANFVATVRYFADMAQHINRRNHLAVKGHTAWTMRQPWGPCGFIFPWNFPFLLLGWGIAPALAAGNTVVVKPAEDTPLSTIYFAELTKEIGIPDGVINVVPGMGHTTGKAVSEHPGFRRMSFTGSPEVGRMVARACGQNLIPVKLELGGKGAAVIFDDVDVLATAEKLTQAITFHTGQVCCDATRWIVHKRIFDRFTSECIDRLKNVTVGHQLEDTTEMGPVVSQKQRSRVLGYIEKAVNDGAKLILDGGTVDIPGKQGHYVRPSLLEGNHDNIAAKEEIFGPVAYLTSFDTEEEALELVNSSAYGLANSVWSTNLNRCNYFAERMEAGNSWINAHNVFPHGVPYGGIKQSGMGGGVNSPETLFDYWRSVSVVRPH